MPAIKDSHVTEIPGDLFDVPEGSALIHACNSQGSWGAGIAKVFKQKYPAAYRYYHNHCRVHREKPTRHEITNLQAEDKSTISVRFPLGTALVIPPQPGDKRNGHKQHWVVCLFTSRGFGGRVDSPDSIVNSTSAALQDLKRQLDELEECSRGSGEPLSGKLFSCRFNSGLFAVPWARSRELLEEVGLDVTVVYPPGDESKQ